MGKIVLWIVVVFVVLFALRLINAGKARRRADAARRGGTPPDVPMVRCAALRRLPAARRRHAGSRGLHLRRRGLQVAALTAMDVPAAPSKPASSRCRARRRPWRAVTPAGRRNLLTVGLYRVACAAVLLGIALVLDLKTISVAAPYSFVAAAAFYFAFGLGSTWWIRRDPYPVPLPFLLSALLAGDIFFIALMTVASGGTGGPLPILLFPQLAASGWLLRMRMAFFHAALAAVVLLGLDVWGTARGPGHQRAAVPDRPHRLRLLRHHRHLAPSLGSYAKASEALAAQRGIDIANLEQVNR